MIVDKLAEKSPWIRDFCNRSHLIQAPFAVSPPRESKLDSKTALVPKQGKMISGQFAKPPYNHTVIFGNGEEGQEQGAILVAASGIDDIRKHLPCPIAEDTTHVMKVTVVGFTPRFSCLVSYRFLAFCATHFSSYDNLPLALELSSQAFLEVNNFEPSKAGAEIRLGEADWKDFLSHQVASMAALFALMNCGNIIREPTEPDKKLQRHRKKVGKLPLFRYHVLKIKPVQRAGASSGDGSGIGSSNAIHWVRGHFKEYTPEKPLFGKTTGLFWWQPHLAGNANRFVEKAYELQTEPGPATGMRKPQLTPS